MKSNIPADIWIFMDAGVFLVHASELTVNRREVVCHILHICQQKLLNLKIIVLSENASSDWSLIQEIQMETVSVPINLIQSYGETSSAAGVFSHPFPSMLPLLPWPRPPGLLLWYPRGPRGTGLLLPLQPHLHRKAPRLPPKYLHRFFLSLPLRCGERPLAASPRFHRRPRKYLRPPSVVAVGLLLRFDRNSVPGGSNRRCSHLDSNRCSNLILWILI